MSGILQPPSNVAIRPCVADDQRFIAATAWRSMLGNNRAPSRRRRINDQIDRILDSKDTRCLVACSLTDSDRILGWILYSSAPVARVLHYAYVRDDERLKGIARRLVQQAWPTSQARMVLTLKGPSTRSIMESKRDIQFVPLEEYLR
jgi:GNAT superfamily N-acetyltransferase